MRLTFSLGSKLAPQLKELRIHLSQTDTTSKGVRDFINNGYVQLKTANPKLPILIRECAGIQPRLWARFELGKEKCVPLTDLGSKDVLQQIEKISKQN